MLCAAQLIQSDSQGDLSRLQAGESVMIKSASLLVCCILIIGGFGLPRSAQPERSHDEWLQERYFEATSIKEGMTRADLVKVFRVDGGLQPLGIPTRYVLKSSDMIKVDVEFDIPEEAKGKIFPEDLSSEMKSPAFDAEGRPVPRGDYQSMPNERLKIKSISRPYVEQFNCD
jgi:hypothetical protein